MVFAAGQLEQCIADVGRWMSANQLKLNKDKTELLWVGSRHSLSQQGCCLPILQLSSDTTTACDHVRLLGVTLSSDLSLDQHVSTVSAPCFYWLRQLQHSRRSLDAESAATLDYAFVASRIDYCNAVLACAESDDRQVATSVERCGSSGHRHRHEKVPERLLAASSH